MSCAYGAIWRKWDFHIHTPYSILNNNYGFNPFEMDESMLESAFDEFVTTLFTKAIDNNIAAIGITDYFMLEGYKRIKHKYLASPEKMQQCFPDEELRNRVLNIYIFPNIELRLDTFVGKGSKSVNYHVIFSDDVSESDIEENFLNQLEFKHDAGGKRPLTLSNIRELGKVIKSNNGNPGSELLVGLENVTVSYDRILDVLQKNPSFEGKYLIAIPVDEDLSQIPWAGRDYQTRHNLYKQSNVFLSANDRTAKWALAKGREEQQIREFGSIKPCIWGSDAHEYSKMFCPDANKHCWIKAEPTFEGLMQIVYEPEARVRIQPNQPGEKDSHQIIDSITFIDDNFQLEPVVFNESLTCIIGGKSTGKSLLLRQLAYTIDSQYVTEQERTALSSRTSFAVKSATVKWRDGTTGGRKIVYIPQTYLNKTIDNPEESTAINQIIEGVLLQEPDIKAAHSVLVETTERMKKRTQADIQMLISELQKLRSTEEDIKREGTTDTYLTTIKTLESERTELAEKVNVSQEDIDRFGELEKLIQGLSTTISVLSTEMKKLSEIPYPEIVIPRYFQSTDGISIEHAFDEDFPQSSGTLYALIKIINDKIVTDWNTSISAIKDKIMEEIEDHKKELAQYKLEYDNLKSRVDQSEQLQKLTARIADEGTKLQEAKVREAQRDSIREKICELRKTILASQIEYNSAYEEYGKVVRTTGTKKNTTLIFDVKVIWKREQFMSILSDMFNNRNFAPFRYKYNFDLSELKDNDYGFDLLDNIWKAIDESQSYGGLSIKAGYTFEKTLQQLFDNWYNIHYIVKSGNDTIEEMSPGKKALVLLELLISLEESKCPILIDQPEDDLDNRSIYDDLVQFIRRRKQERQIIIVTHNANIVLGADAEEIIIANQDGKDTENAQKRFEYRSGAIENDEVPVDISGKNLPGILNQKGLQTQICDILEGGKVAFQLRRNKYAVITQ